MKRLIPLLCLLCVVGCVSNDSSNAVPEPDWDTPLNILWLVAEDLSPIIPPFGDSTVTTPNLSRLAAEGVRYTHAFSPSGVCSPSRAAIATGMYPSHIGANHMRTGPWSMHGTSPRFLAFAQRYMPPGVPLYEPVPPPEVKMHSEYMRRAGYYATNNSKEDYQFRAPLTAWDESSDEAHWRNRAPGQPFFSIFNFFVTHESQVWGKAEDSLWVDPNLEVPIPPYLPSTEVAVNDIRRVYSNIKEMDAQVGDILADLEADGLLENTIVVWYSDHGGPLPRQKRLLYDSGIHFPMIIRYPNGWRAGEIDDRLVSFVDFAPTLLSMAGMAPPEHMDGQAFEGKYKAESPRAYIHSAADRFDEAYDMIRAVRDHRFKYLRNFQTDRPYYLPLGFREQMPIMKELLRIRDAGELSTEQSQWFRTTKPQEELFDTQVDPFELNNIAGDPQYADKLAELRTEAERWMTEINDKGNLPEVELVGTMWPDLVQPTTAEPEADWIENNVSLQSTTQGASIAYQWIKAGDSTGTSWQVYTDPMPVRADESLIAIAHRIGYKPSKQVVLAEEEN